MKTKIKNLHLHCLQVMWLNINNKDFRALRYTYHFLECTFYGPNNQALMRDLLLSEEACWRRAGRARGSHTTAQGGRPCQCPAVGGWVVRLLSQARGWEDSCVSQDVHDLLQLLQNMVLQQFGSDHSCPWPSVSIKQGPVVQVDPIWVLEKQEGEKGKEKRWSLLHSCEWGDWWHRGSRWNTDNFPRGNILSELQKYPQCQYNSGWKKRCLFSPHNPHHVFSSP